MSRRKSLENRRRNPLPDKAVTLLTQMTQKNRHEGGRLGRGQVRSAKRLVEPPLTVIAKGGQWSVVRGFVRCPLKRKPKRAHSIPALGAASISLRGPNPARVPTEHPTTDFGQRTNELSLARIARSLGRPDRGLQRGVQSTGPGFVGASHQNRGISEILRSFWLPRPYNVEIGWNAPVVPDEEPAS